ncbi:BQ5605_C013g07146 [Microbotryum silenes-dioicae]|uniref:Sensitive to high expression protein 9, mitochondrial n=1 Tax=Microbotryum silenes-dioicae TaxID=796604 RepID=A0A2X0MKE8_9BASI|nr:BQ5605_C013g07146 [Microbotryum silenes-dioicae]
MDHQMACAQLEFPIDSNRTRFRSTSRRENDRRASLRTVVWPSSTPGSIAREPMASTALKSVSSTTCSACYWRLTRTAPGSTRRVTHFVTPTSTGNWTRLHSYSTSSTAPSSDTTTPPASTLPSSSSNTTSASAPRNPNASQTAQRQLNSLLATLDNLARKQSASVKETIRAWELERRLRDVGGKINAATGYVEIDLLRKGVVEREKALNAAREVAGLSKQAFAAAVAVRAASQKEVNDLLQRKHSWTSADVMRFTELIQQDHENEQAEAKARVAAEKTEQEVESGFSELMQAILERYHEEQVWSDKVGSSAGCLTPSSKSHFSRVSSQIRSLSTYGSLGITSLNVLLFIITILLVEPWKRRRLVEGVEARLRENANEGQEATMASLLSLQSLLTDAQEKLDRLVTSTTSAPLHPNTPTTISSTLSPPSSTLDDSELPTCEEAVLSFPDGSPLEKSDPEQTSPTISGTWSWHREYPLQEQDLRMLAFGGVGVAVGICVAAVAALLSR